MEELQLEGKRIMVVGAHPDDCDFLAAGTAARASSLGCDVVYVIATKGDRGSNDPRMTAATLTKIRQREQTEAARILGVLAIEWLGYRDGELEADINLKGDITRMIRKHKPDIVITFDPAYIYDAERGRVNHTDHRKVGEATMDAVYPLARDALSFPGHAEAGYGPHAVRELCFVSHKKTNAYCDITGFFERKIEALSKHESQLRDMERVEGFVRQWSEQAGKQAGVQLAEGFIRLEFRPL